MHGTHLEDTVTKIKPKAASSMLLWIIVAFVVAFFVWAAFTELDRTVRGQGRVVPSSQLQVVSNLEGGVVQDILVRAGQVVRQGDELIRLDRTATGAATLALAARRALSTGRSLSATLSGRLAGWCRGRFGLGREGQFDAEPCQCLGGAGDEKDVGGRGRSHDDERNQQLPNQANIPKRFARRGTGAMANDTIGISRSTLNRCNVGVKPRAVHQPRCRM